MAVAPSVAKAWQQRTECYLTQGYGLSETSPVISICRQDESFNNSVGLPVPGTDVCIMDAKHNILPLGEQGEICIKGPQVMMGYWQNDIATKNTIDEKGFLHTGDVGYIDAHGYLYISDRLKDMIIFSGFNVCSIEVEKTIMQMKEVSEAAVIGVPSKKHGEKVVAYVVLKPNKKLKASHIIAYAKEHLAHYKAPSQVVFVQELPKSTVGKILKRNLKTIFAGKNSVHVL